MQRILGPSSSPRRRSHRSGGALAKQRSNLYNRRLQCEVLEDRRLLSVAGPLTSLTGASPAALVQTVHAADTTTVNHAPVGTSNTITTPENTPYVFAASDFGFSDPNDTPPNNFKAVEITTLPTVGSLTDNGTAVMAAQFVSVTDINGGLLTFTPVTSGVGSNYDSFTFQVQDDGGTANGGVDTDPTPKTMTINVGVNHAPVGTSNTVTTDVNTPYTFAASDFGFSDPNDTPPNNFLAVDITTLPTVGSLADNGAAVTAGHFVSVSDINSGLFTFVPLRNGAGNNYDSFTFQVQDDGGTAGGGVDTDPTRKQCPSTSQLTWGRASPVLVAFDDPTAARERPFPFESIPT